MTRRRTVAVAVVIIAVLAFGAYVAVPKPQVHVPSTGVYSTDFWYETQWDPSQSHSSAPVMNAVYETLVRYDPSNDTYLPILATSWTISPDDLTYTFVLRHGVKFHTGDEFNATAVKYSIDRNMRGWDGKGPQGSSYIWWPVNNITVLDRYTVQFVLSVPVDLLSIASAAYSAWIYDPYVTQKYGHDWYSQGNESGTGPYMISKIEKDLNRIILTRFPDYWQGWSGNHFDTVIIESVPDWSTARLELEAGQIDIVDRLPTEYFATLANESAIRLVKTPSYQNMLGFFNTRKAPLNNTLVRQALSYAVPYSDIVQSVMGGYANQSKGSIPAGMWGHGDELPQYTTNLTKAKELLTKAGYPNGGFSLTYTYESGDEYQMRSGELYKAELATLGITLNLRGLPWAEQQGMAGLPNPSDRQDIFVMYWWPDYPDPYTFLQPMFHSESTINFNMAYWYNTAFDDLIDNASVMEETNRIQARADLITAQRMLIDQAVAIFFFDQIYVRAIRANFMGYVDNPAYPNVVFWYDCYRGAATTTYSVGQLAFTSVVSLKLLPWKRAGSILRR